MKNLLVAGFLIGLFPSVAQAGAYYYCTTNLNPHGDNWVAMRSDPSTKTGYRIRKLGPNVSLDLVHWADRGRWAYVRTGDGSEGYISSQFIYKCAD